MGFPAKRFSEIVGPSYRTWLEDEVFMNPRNMESLVKTGKAGKGSSRPA